MANGNDILVADVPDAALLINPLKEMDVGADQSCRMTAGEFTDGDPLPAPEPEPPASCSDRLSPSSDLDYLYADWPRAQFHLFSWAAFAFAGSAVGRLALGEDRPLRLLGLAAALFLVGWLADRLPPVYAHQEFWRTSPSWFAMRLGGVMAMSAVLQALPAGADRPLSWLRTMGRHSLLGYFVSIEIPYGILSWPIHKRLGMGQAVGAAGAMLALTWAVSAAADRWDAWRRARRAAAAA